MTDYERIALYTIDDEIAYFNKTITELKEGQPAGIRTSTEIQRDLLRCNYILTILKRTRRNMELRFELYKKNPDLTHVIPKNYLPSNFEGSGT